MWCTRFKTKSFRSHTQIQRHCYQLLVSVLTYQEVSYLSVGAAPVEVLTADWLERTVDGESDRRSGSSQRCCSAELRAGTEIARHPKPPHSHFLCMTAPPPNAHKHKSSAEKKVFKGRRTGYRQLSPRRVVISENSLFKTCDFTKRDEERQKKDTMQAVLELKEGNYKRKAVWIVLRVHVYGFKCPFLEFEYEHKLRGKNSHFTKSHFSASTFDILSLYYFQSNKGFKWFVSHCILFIFNLHFTYCNVPAFLECSLYFTFASIHMTSSSNILNICVNCLNILKITIRM